MGDWGRSSASRTALQPTAVVQGRPALRLGPEMLAEAPLTFPVLLGGLYARYWLM
jgi:hypothetical protein